MIATANPIASEAGREILRAGGSAVDAAIASQLVLTLVEPQSSGIGGGAFLMHFQKKTKKVEAYDGRETAPLAISAGVFQGPDGKRRAFSDISAGGAAVGIPGVIRMLALAHSDHGKLPWWRLFEPAIRLAEEGFAVSPRLNAMIKSAQDLKRFHAARNYFYTPSGEPLPVGYRLRNPALADTLRRIAAGGPDAFYVGVIARDIATAVKNARRNAAKMTVADIAQYTAKKRRPLCRIYRKYRVCGMPPPTSGGLTVLQILGLLEPFDMPKLRPSSVKAIHFISEASRLAYADRGQYIGDPDFVEVPVLGLLDDSYLRSRSRQISASSTMGKAFPGQPPGSVSGRRLSDNREGFPSTSHLSVVDNQGNSVSLTMSIERAFGSHLFVRGFLLNNQLTDFAHLPQSIKQPMANAIAPGKRPRSSMSPMLIFDQDGKLFATIGSPGGSRIIAYVVKAIVGLIDWNLDMQSAIDLPNHVNRNGATELEKDTEVTKRAYALRQLKHEVRIRVLNSGLQGIRITPQGFDGGADSRREGIAIGD